MSRHEIIEELDALSLHYSRPHRSPEEQDRFLSDYLEDLDGFSIEAIRLACRGWRQSDATKFPKPGELLVFVRRNVKTEGPKPKFWGEVTDAEYEALPLAAKIDHHRLMAHQCRRRAGPMWTNTPVPRALTREEMPPRWHELQRQARNHDDEAKRMQDVLRRMKLQEGEAA